ncbi:hemolysin XhlA family protein [Gottfriedia acidiceleris]|uniref:hemolysin XhlA family protein n=1 Tax=Gottfriedia acidiceleris TaxID=371036 RepID=UPI003000767C
MWIDEIKVRLAVAESTIVKVKQKIERIESNTSWTVRLIIGAIIMAVIRIVLKGGI